MSSGDFFAYRKSNFSSAFFLLGHERRRALSAVYAFARAVDDIADDKDRSPTRKKEAIDAWRLEIKKLFSGHPSPGLPQELYRSSRRFCLKEELFIEIIDGVSRDVDGAEYENFTELKKYMRQVACAPGLLTLDILEYGEPGRSQLAENLGYAVQLTNILRDVYRDAEIGRFYLPCQDMKRFGVTREFIKEGGYSPDFAALMDFEASRARDFYSHAAALISGAPAGKLLIPAVMGNIYLDLLGKLEKIRFDVRRKIPKISKPGKIKAVLKSCFGGMDVEV